MPIYNKLRTFIGTYQSVKAPTHLGTNPFRHQNGMFRHHIILHISIMIFHRFNNNYSIKCYMYIMAQCYFQNVDIYITGTSFIRLLLNNCLLFTCTFQFYLTCILNLLIQIGNTGLPMYVKFFCVYMCYNIKFVVNIYCKHVYSIFSSILYWHWSTLFRNVYIDIYIIILWIYTNIFPLITF